MNNKKISISTESMLQYLKDFNYIEMKYGVSSDEEKVELDAREQLDQFGKVQKISPAYIGHGMETLYRLDALCISKNH